VKKLFVAVSLIAIESPSLATTPSARPSPPDMAAVYANQPTVQEHADDFGDWWRQFGDPVLDTLVDRALAQNIDIAAAVTRIAEARAIRGTAAAQGRPQIDLGVVGERQRVSGYQVGFPGPETANAFSAGVNASWELDLFGRIRKGVQAADADILASTEDSRTARLAVITEVTRTYLEARGLERQLAIVKEGRQTQDETAAYTRVLFTAGAVARADVDRAEAQAASTAADAPAIELQRQIAIHRISVLLASPAQDLYEALQTTVTDARAPAAAVGIPAELLRRRPDVRSAEARVAGAYARLGVAKADLKPHLTLVGSIGTLVNSFSGVGLTRSIAWLAGASASQPLFDGGTRRSVVNLRRADQARFEYQAAVLTAVADVENALASIARDDERVTALDTAAAKARSAADQVRRAWRAGESPILDLLEAERNQLAAEEALAQAQTADLRDHAGLFAALGG
jgi:NodT family efflux transporter outer membrane factor (OMF) lipoprotein